jgi:hypothetical protein
MAEAADRETPTPTPGARLRLAGLRDNVTTGL